MRLRWTRRAERDLEAIEHYIKGDNPTAAARVVLNIIGQVEQLRDHPGMGRSGRVEGARELVITGLPYIVAYIAEAQIVEVLRVLHAARRWPATF